MKVRKAIIPAAGLGTRLLPNTKSIPKEMLPLVDKPVIQYIVEEAVSAGVEEILIITNRGKSPIEDYFDYAPDLEERLMRDGKEKDARIVRSVADMADIFVSDAFGTVHRAHASTAGVADYLPAYCGFLVEKELSALGGAMDDPKRPLVAVLGGAKVADKLAVIENLLKLVNNLILGGGMTYTFKAALGGKVGDSICEPDQFQTAKDILAKAKELGVNIYLAEDAVAADAFSAARLPSFAGSAP